MVVAMVKALGFITMTSGGFLRVLLPLVPVALLAVACGSGAGVSIPPGADELEPCSFGPIKVDELPDIGVPGCDLVGASIVLPDATMLTVPAVGEVFAQQQGDDSLECHIVNWGVPGVGVTAVKDGELVALWASSDEAGRLQREQLKVDNVAGSESLALVGIR